MKLDIHIRRHDDTADLPDNLAAYDAPGYIVWYQDEEGRTIATYPSASEDWTPFEDAAEDVKILGAAIDGLIRHAMYGNGSAV